MKYFNFFYRIVSLSPTFVTKKLCLLCFCEDGLVYCANCLSLRSFIFPAFSVTLEIYSGDSNSECVLCARERASHSIWKFYIDFTQFLFNVLCDL